ncbi:MAG: cellulose binding domain-containing protein [Pseudomonadota bacterium]
MKTSTFKKHGFIKALGTLALSCALSPLAYADWSVQGSQILDPAGKPFVYRGVNLGILPTVASLPQVYADIAATGANAIRIPIDNLTSAQAEVHVHLCKQHKLVCVFTYVLSAGYVDNFRAPNSLHLINVWQGFTDLLKANPDHVVIDIASAMAGNTASLDFYTGHYHSAITFIRHIWGLKNQMIISGGNWGQDWSFLMRDNAETLLALDPLKNTVLSVHMYEAYRDAPTVRSYLESFTTRNLPIIIAEFGPIKRDRFNERINPYTTTDVAVDAVMNISQELSVGYLGWNWSGYKTNDPSLNLPDYSPLNLVTDYNPEQITPWGNKLINSDAGIKATAKVATHFPEGSSSSSASSVGNLPPKAEITYEITSAPCGALAGTATAYASDPEGDPLSFAWEIYQSNTMTTTYGTGPSIPLIRPAQSATTITLTVDDGHGNVVKAITTLALNNNTDTCASSSSIFSSSSTPSSSSISKSRSSTPVSSVPSSRPRSSTNSSSSIAAQGNCRYVINNQWDKGFTASIRVKNTGSQPIQGWDVRWQYTDNSSITNSWNVKLAGQNPYSAKNENWNATIKPGQTVEFGFNGRKPAGPAQIPVVTGSVCQ